MARKVLFLTLKVFGFTGGIEKVCRIICRALYDLSVEEVADPAVYSMYDKYYDRDSKYLKKSQYHAFDGNRKRFVLRSLFKGITSDVVILSHIHLLSVGYLIKRFRPSTKVYLLAHGIEIWRKLPEAKLKALRRLDKIIAVSQYTADMIEDIHEIDSGKIEILNNCLDPFYYYPQQFEKPEFLLKRHGLHENQTILFSLSRLSSSEKYKGYDHTFEILSHLIKKKPELMYVLAGKYDTEEKRRLDKLIAKFRIEKHVKLIGFVDEAEITDYFLLSDIFIMPSKKEGFGIVFIEAMASGLRVIAGNKDGSVDALKQGELGKLVDPDNLSEIEGALIDLLDHPINTEEKLALQAKVFHAFNYEKYRESIRNAILCGTTYFCFI
ncbi:MAG: glycosyltransferase family 4 protein [Bacteroidia bacterium]